MATIMSMMERRNKPKRNLKFDPFLKLPNGEKSSNKFIANIKKTLGYSSQMGTWIGINPLAECNGKIV